MSMITNSARFLLFGPKLDSRVTLANVAKTKAINMGRGAMGLPPSKGPSLWDWIVHKAKEFIAALTGRHPDRLPLPEDLPATLFQTVNETLKNRGGLHDKDLGLPNYWVTPSNATSTPFFWSLVVDYSSAADPAKVASFEMALEDQLTKAGYDYNVRIQKRPLRIEIDKPKPPTITLAELWPIVATYPQNQRWAVLGLAYLGGQSTTLFMSLEGEDFSGFIAGSPGSGKTQLSMSVLLSLAMTNSPNSMAMIIIDPKAVDFRPFNALPHLAMPVITDATRAAEVVASLCDEMDRRTACAAKGDNSFFAHSICLYVDELADLVMSLPDSQAQTLTNNIQRLGQKGRGVGFVVLGATQRVYDIPATMHSKLNARIVGKMRTAGDSVAASGIPGTTTNKLPGRGSFELYSSDQQGLRLQAPFVAASDKPGFANKLKPFFDDIRQRWQDVTPGWTPNAENTPKPEGDKAPIVQDSAQTSDQAEQVAEAQPVEQAPAIDPALLKELQEEYVNDPEAFSVRTVRRVYALLNQGKRMNTNKERAVFDLFMTTHAETLLET